MSIIVNLCHATTFLLLDTNGKTQKALIFHDLSTSLSNVTELNPLRVCCLLNDITMNNH